MSLDNLNTATPATPFAEEIHDDNYVLNELKTLELAKEIPFGANKTAVQNVQLAIDPSEGLTRKRYAYLSNETLFDTTLISEVEAAIRLATRSTQSSDEARIRSAVAGQYLSQSLGQPGLAVVFDDDNITLTDGQASLSHGEAYFGAFLWDNANANVETGFGFKLDTDGLEFFVRSLGNHIGDSPVAQSDFSKDSFDGTGPTGEIIDPSDGFIANFPFTWYNQGTITGGFVSKINNRLEIATKERVDGRPSIDDPNLPVQCVIRNNGTAQQLGVEVGGIQFTTYGAGVDEVERRQTAEARVTASNYVSNTRTLTENAVDPTAEPGKPLVSFQRDTSENRTTNLRSANIQAQVGGGDIYVFAWDEYNPNAALTNESFTNPITPNNAGEETHLLTDTQADDYSPDTAVLRRVTFFPGGGGNNKRTAVEMTDTRIPLDATRIYTAVNGGNSATLDPFKVTISEGY